ncbi:hypothetical protein ACTI_19750 [Actinoplanes sp. OR16]|uniref:DUF5994 family protein n=1 Tax=Actinoplanes sp. OR16 TaxID=946334 RepID=UPI000F71C990|nr:DUF5994 family protein [Actinoplanes sp. OR16]BBH65290.1 hypothetical protein ACTI_19750 [Actinoplanes sp. OR16]
MTLRPAFLSPAERPERASFDGTWWPQSLDLDVELRALLPMLDHVRGPVRRLVLSAEGWANGPDRVVVDGGTVDVDYPADRGPWTMTVVCVDGGTFTMRVVPPGPSRAAPDGPSRAAPDGPSRAAPDGPSRAAPDGTEARLETDAWETEGGGLGLPRLRAV